MGPLRTPPGVPLDWFSATLLATACYGCMQASQKIAASRGHRPAALLLGAGLVASGVAALGALLYPPSLPVGPAVLGYAAANALLFSSGSLLLLLALARAPAAVVLPVHKLDSLLVVLVGVLVFANRPAPLQWLGIACGLGVVVVLTLPSSGAASSERRAGLLGVGLAGLAAICFAGSMTVGKLASVAVPRLPYVAVSYALTASYGLAVLLVQRSRKPEETAPLAPVSSLAWGALAGLLNVIGYLCLLEAFSAGPIALVQGVFASSLLIAVLLAALVTRERPRPRELLAMGLSLAALLLIRLGSGG